MRFFAECIGWSFMACAVALFIVCGIRFSWAQDGVYQLCFYDFGPVVIDGAENPGLVSGCKMAGYNIVMVGRFAVSFSYPTWVFKLIRKLSKKKTPQESSR